MISAPPRRNAYRGRCEICRESVDRQCGYLTMTGTGWRLSHGPELTCTALSGTKPTTTKEQAQMQVFEYIVTLEPRDEKGKVNSEQITLVAGPTVKLARDEESVKRAAIRDLDASVNVDDVKVLVRPFGGY